MDKSVFTRMMAWSAQKGWSQSDLATRLSVSPQNITNWKARGVPAERHADIASLFGRSVEQLLGKEAESTLALTWPYQNIDKKKFFSIDAAKAPLLEGAILLAAAQLGIDVKKD